MFWQVQGRAYPRSARRLLHLLQVRLLFYFSQFSSPKGENQTISFTERLSWILAAIANGKRIQFEPRQSRLPNWFDPYKNFKGQICHACHNNI